MIDFIIIFKKFSSNIKNYIRFVKILGRSKYKE